MNNRNETTSNFSPYNDVNIKHDKFVELQKKLNTINATNYSSAYLLYNSLKEIYQEFRIRMEKTLALHNKSTDVEYKNCVFDFFIKINAQANEVSKQLEIVADQIVNLEMKQNSSLKGFDYIEFVKIHLQRVEHEIYAIDFYPLVDNTRRNEHYLSDLQEKINFVLNVAQETLQERKDAAAIELLNEINLIRWKFLLKSEEIVKGISDNVKVNPFNLADNVKLPSSVKIKFLNKLVNEEKPAQKRKRVSDSTHSNNSNSSNTKAKVTDTRKIYSSRNRITNSFLYNVSLTPPNDNSQSLDDSEMSDSDATQSMPKSP